MEVTMRQQQDPKTPIATAGNLLLGIFWTIIVIISTLIHFGYGPLLRVGFHITLWLYVIQLAWKTTNKNIHAVVFNTLLIFAFWWIPFSIMRYIVKAAWINSVIVAWVVWFILAENVASVAKELKEVEKTNNTQHR
jgi:predicted membrane protein